MSSSLRPWLQHEDRYLREQYPVNPSLTVMAQRLGRTKQELYDRASELSIYRSPKTVQPAAPTTRRSARDARPAPTRLDGEQIVATWRDRDLRRASAAQLKSIIDVLERLHRDDVGLWEESILRQARAAQALRQENNAREELAHA